jgi:uncharacterized Rmd1/YagE family protein
MAQEVSIGNFTAEDQGWSSHILARSTTMDYFRKRVSPLLVRITDCRKWDIEALECHSEE